MVPAIALGNELIAAPQESQIGLQSGEVFEERMKRLTAELTGQFKKSRELEVEIKENLKGLEYEV